LDEAIKWIEASTLLNENYWNMRTKARLLEKKGRKDEAITTMERAIEIGNGMKDKPFDFDQMKEMLSDWKK
jgi:predicted RNA polymerase sigma factor